MDYIYWMEKAYKEGLTALELDEIPIGCVIVFENKIIGRGYNKRNSNKNALAHAEIIAINEACNYICDWRLENCTLFVTIEPCPMCAGAIVQARIPTVVFGAKNSKAGCGGSIINILEEPRFNHQVEVVSGILEESCSELMKQFFKSLRS